jgi:hypothetical protein
MLLVIVAKSSPFHTSWIRHPFWDCLLLCGFGGDGKKQHVLQCMPIVEESYRLVQSLNCEQWLLAQVSIYRRVFVQFARTEFL